MVVEIFPYFMYFPFFCFKGEGNGKIFFTTFLR